MAAPPAAGLPRWVEAPAAALGLLLASPVLLLAAALIKLSSRGPVLFRQERIGRGGRPFTLLKLRSMLLAGEGPRVTAAGDRRITAVGRLLRKTKLDELPELWNVLRGEMALVGPRPEVPDYVDPEDPLWQPVLTARPGLTDPTTLRLRNEEELLAAQHDPAAFYRQVLLPFKLRGYARYLEERGPWSDLVVLVRTAGRVIFPRRAPLPTLEEIERGAGPERSASPGTEC